MVVVKAFGQPKFCIDAAFSLECDSLEEAITFITAADAAVADLFDLASSLRSRVYT